LLRAPHWNFIVVIQLVILFLVIANHISCGGNWC